MLSVTKIDGDLAQRGALPPLWFARRNISFKHFPSVCQYSFCQSPGLYFLHISTWSSCNFHAAFIQIRAMRFCMRLFLISFMSVSLNTLAIWFVVSLACSLSKADASFALIPRAETKKTNDGIILIFMIIIPY